MERLQAAIAKARMQRGVQPPAQPAQAPQGTQLPGPRRDPADPELVNRWKALQEFDFSALPYSGDLPIMTLKSGAMAAPFDILRTRMLNLAQTNGWKRIAITSPHAGCGKTMIAANLSFSLARQSELRIITIDFDLRRTNLARILGQTVSATMGDVLEKRLSFAEHALRYGDNLAFGLNANSIPNSAELLQSTQTREILAEIEDSYAADIMLFDMPPLRSTDDSIGFLRAVDAVIIVAAAEQTPIGQIDVAERQVAELSNVMGVVLNKCRIMSGEHGYEQYGYS
jgi:Mrp family chromosome partitioning ATPase